MTEHAPADAPPQPAWGIGEAVLAYVIGVFVSAGAAAGGVAVTNDTESVGTTIAGTVGLWFGFVGVPWLAITVRRTGRVVDALRLRVRPLDVPVGAVAGAFSSVVLVWSVYMLLRALDIVDQADLDRVDDPSQQLFDSATGLGLTALVLVVVVGAPIAEEIFFRGFLQPALVRRTGAVAGVSITAVVFALTHFQRLQFPGLLAFGLVLGVLAHRAGRLGPAIVAHMVFNAITVSVLLL